MNLLNKVILSSVLLFFCCAGVFANTFEIYEVKDVYGFKRLVVYKADSEEISSKDASLAKLRLDADSFYLPLSWDMLTIKGYDRKKDEGFLVATRAVELNNEGNLSLKVGKFIKFYKYTDDNFDHMKNEFFLSQPSEYFCVTVLVACNKCEALAFDEKFKQISAKFEILESFAPDTACFVDGEICDRHVHEVNLDVYHHLAQRILYNNCLRFKH